VADLSIRPAHNDQRVLADLIASSTGGWSGRGKPVVQRLILDAAVAIKQPQLAKDAAAAGIPVVVDPMTYLLQYETPADHPWSSLSFGAAKAVSSSAFESAGSKRALVRDVVEFQLARGASAIVPPYFYARDPKDPVFTHGLNAIRETRRFMDEAGLKMPLLPVLCGRVDAFTHPESWPQGLDWFVERATAHGAESIAIQLSPLGDAGDSYAKLLYAFQTVQRVVKTGLRSHLWRQGAFGPAFVAAGASGFETGLQWGNKSDLSSVASNRRPVAHSASEKHGGGGGQYFLPALNRWIIGKQADALNSHSATRDLMVCDDPVNCCSAGYEASRPIRREHAVRAQARSLARLTAMPPLVSWRMHQVSMDAAHGVDLIDRMNKVLSRQSLPLLKDTSHRALARIAEEMSKYATTAA